MNRHRELSPWLGFNNRTELMHTFKTIPVLNLHEIYNMYSIGLAIQ